MRQITCKAVQFFQVSLSKMPEPQLRCGLGRHYMLICILNLYSKFSSLLRFSLHSSVLESEWKWSLFSFLWKRDLLSHNPCTLLLDLTGHNEDRAPRSTVLCQYHDTFANTVPPKHNLWEICLLLCKWRKVKWHKVLWDKLLGFYASGEVSPST